MDSFILPLAGKEEEPAGVGWVDIRDYLMVGFCPSLGFHDHATLPGLHFIILCITVKKGSLRIDGASSEKCSLGNFRACTCPHVARDILHPGFKP